MSHKPKPKPTFRRFTLEVLLPILLIVIATFGIIVGCGALGHWLIGGEGGRTAGMLLPFALVFIGAYGVLFMIWRDVG